MIWGITVINFPDLSFPNHKKIQNKNQKQNKAKKDHVLIWELTDVIYIFTITHIEIKINPWLFLVPTQQQNSVLLSHIFTKEPIASIRIRLNFKQKIYAGKYSEENIHFKTLK